jgi:hypothetical protein
LAGFDDASQGHDLLSGGSPWAKTPLQAQEAGIEGREIGHFYINIILILIYFGH